MCDEILSKPNQPFILKSYFRSGLEKSISHKQSTQDYVLIELCFKKFIFSPVERKIHSYFVIQLINYVSVQLDSQSIAKTPTSQDQYNSIYKAKVKQQKNRIKFVNRIQKITSHRGELNSL